MGSAMPSGMGMARLVAGSLCSAALTASRAAMRSASEVGWPGGSGMPASRSSTAALSRVSRATADGPALRRRRLVLAAGAGGGQGEDGRPAGGGDGVVAGGVSGQPVGDAGREGGGGAAAAAGQVGDGVQVGQVADAAGPPAAVGADDQGDAGFAGGVGVHVGHPVDLPVREDVVHLGGPVDPQHDLVAGVGVHVFGAGVLHDAALAGEGEPDAGGPAAAPDVGDVLAGLVRDRGTGPQQGVALVQQDQDGRVAGGGEVVFAAAGGGAEPDDLARPMPRWPALWRIRGGRRGRCRRGRPGPRPSRTGWCPCAGRCPTRACRCGRCRLRPCWNTGWFCRRWWRRR